MARYEAQRAEREALVEEIAQKKTQVARLDEEIREKMQNLANKADKPASAASNKLEYFEGEVRRLESQLTQ